MANDWGKIDANLDNLLADLEQAPASGTGAPAAGGDPSAAALDELDSLLTGLHTEVKAGPGPGHAAAPADELSDLNALADTLASAAHAPAPGPGPVPADIPPPIPSEIPPPIPTDDPPAIPPPISTLPRAPVSASLPTQRVPQPAPVPPAQAVPADAPRCGGCNQPIIGPCLQAVGHKWHPEHFTCVRCKRAFNGASFYVHENQAYCEADYQELFALRCAGCLRPIEDKCISALGKKWHREHFVCSGCEAPLAGKPFVERGGNAFCKDCKTRMDAERDGQKAIHTCGKCGKPIYGEFIMLQGKYIHPEHFSCAECGAQLKGGKCFEYDGNMYCEFDYQKLMSSACAGCKKSIDGRTVTACGRQWHPECFRCTVCEEAFPGGQFFEKDNKPYCQAHFYKLFGDVCQLCQKPIGGQGMRAMGLQWHMEHFNCAGCNLNLAKKSYCEYNMKPLCKKCFGRLPSDVRKKAEKAKEQRQKDERARQKR